MKCELCGHEATYWEGNELTEATGPEGTCSVVLVSDRTTLHKKVCRGCAVGLRRLGYVCSALVKRRQSPGKQAIQKNIPLLDSFKVVRAPARCTGCRLRVPIEFGGEGLHCFSGNGSCPDSAVRLATLLSGKESFETVEEMMEVLRL